VLRTRALWLSFSVNSFNLVVENPPGLGVQFSARRVFFCGFENYSVTTDSSTFGDFPFETRTQRIRARRDRIEPNKVNSAAC